MTAIQRGVEAFRGQNDVLRATGRAIVFIDPAVAEFQALAAGTRDGLRSVVLDPRRGAFEQIADALCHGARYDAIHIVAHGSPGEIAFASGYVSHATLDRHTGALARIGAALASDAELLLWVCAVGRGAAGQSLIDALAKATGADVGAATHLVGAPERGGAWMLDVGAAAGARAPFARETIAGYRGALAAKLYYVTYGDDAGDAGLSVINADGTHQQTNLVPDTVSFGSHDANGFGLGSAWVETVVDPSAGFYFVLEENAFSADSATLYRGVLGSSAEPVAADTFDGPNAGTDVVGGLQIDTVNHHIYVGYTDYDNNTDYNVQPNTTGIIQMDYNASTGALSNTTNYLVTETSNPIPADFFGYYAPVDFALGDGALFFVQQEFEHATQIYRVDLATGHAVNVVLNQTQFPADWSGGIINDVEIDTTNHLLFFTVSEDSNQAGSNVNNGIWRIADTATGSTSATEFSLTGILTDPNFSPGDMTFDPVSRVLYVESKEDSNGSDDLIYAFQVNSTGTAITSLLHTFTAFPGNPADSDASVGGLAIVENAAPTLTGLDPATFQENTVNTAPQIIDSAVVFSDADDTDYTGGSMTVSYSGGSGGAQDNLSIHNFGSGATQIGVSGAAISYEGNAFATITTSGASGANLVISFDNANATPTAIDALIQALQYQNTSNTPTATRTISIVVTDPSGGQNSAATSLITVNAENDAPVVTSSGNTSYTEVAAPVFANSGLTVTDPDSPNLVGATVTITNAVAGDELTINGTTSGTITGINYSFAAGVLTLTNSATVADYQAALDAVKFDSTSHDPTNGNSSRTLNWQVDDGSASNHASNVATSSIAITAVNDAPGLSVPPNYSGTPGNGITINGISFADVDGESGAELATFSAASGTFSGAGFVGVTIGGNGTNNLTLTGTVAALNAYISGNNLQYTTATSQQITVDIDDQGNTGTPGALHTSITSQVSVNATPVIANAGNTVSYTEQQTSPAAILVDSAITVTDSDSATLSGATVKITAGLVAGDILDADTAGTGITAVWDGVDTLTLSGADTPANYQKVLESVTYASPSDDPTNGGAALSRTVTWTATDDLGAASTPVTTTINITAINDAPVATITPTSYSATEQTSLDLKGSLSVSDADGAGGSETVTLSLTGEGALIVTPGGSGAGVAGSGTNSVTITGTAADINALLTTDGTSTVSYIDNSDTPAASVTLTLAINDNGHTGGASVPSSDTATINITAVNDVPILTGFGDVSSYTENGASVALDTVQNASVSDAELNVSGLNYSGATLTIARNGGANPDDTFSPSGTLALDPDGNVSPDGGSTFIGTYINAGDGSLVITFNASATATDIASVMQQIAYANVSENPPASVQIDFTFSDGNGQPGGQPQGSGATPCTTTASFTVNITQVDDAPVLISVAPGAGYTPGSPGSVLSSGLQIFDPDAVPPSPFTGLAGATVKIATGFFAGDQLFVNLPTDGSGHFITPDTGTSNIFVQSNAAGQMVLSGTDSVLAYQEVLDAVSYRSTSADPSNGGANPTRNITWQVNDGLLNSQTPSTDPNSPVNDTLLHFTVAPIVDLDGSTAGNNYVTSFTENGAALAIVDTDVSVTDPDDATISSATIVLANAKPGDALSIAGALPGGINSLIDTSVSGQITIHLANTGTLADYQTALQQIRFVNTSDNPNPTDRDITVQVSNIDNSNVAHATIHVVPVNDAPVAVAGSASGDAGTVISGTLHATDPDSPSLSFSAVDLPAHGTLAVNSDGSFSYTPFSFYDGPDSFTFKANDGSLDSNLGTEAITVNPVAPEGVVWAGSLDYGAHPLPYQVEGVGDFNGDGTADVLWRNPTTGAVDEWVMANGQWSASISLGVHGARVVGVGDFNHDGTDDVLWRDPNTGAVDEWVMVNGQRSTSINLGNHGTDWQVVGVGDFNGDGTADVLWRNPTTGAVDEWVMANGQWSASISLGGHGTDWQVAGVGDFDHNGASDVLWRNSTTGQVDEWRMANGQWLSSQSLGSHGTDWQVAGIGDFNHNATDDVLWRRPSDGAMDGWVMDHGQWFESTKFGPFDTNFNVAGIGDFNHAGGEDVLWNNPTTGQAQSWLLSPDGH